jgi:hypothetical protein
MKMTAALLHWLRCGAASLLAAGLWTSAAAAQVAPSPHPVIELRQYKIVAGRRDAMIALFDRNFVESQEATGARLIGQYRDLDDADRFTWIRGFESMAARGRSLHDFYFGPVWRANRAAANAMLDDNDNVLLLRPAEPGSGFAKAHGVRAPVDALAPAGDLLVATIHYLWKDPAEGFAAFFRDRLAPAYAAAGLPVLASYVTETEPNNFPQLPVRQHERVFVWFTRVADQAAYDRARASLVASPAWREQLGPQLDDYEERPPQLLRLAPTPRSLLR